MALCAEQLHKVLCLNAGVSNLKLNFEYVQSHDNIECCPRSCIIYLRRIQDQEISRYKLHCFEFRRSQISEKYLQTIGYYKTPTEVMRNNCTADCFTQISKSCSNLCIAEREFNVLNKVKLGKLIAKTVKLHDLSS